MNLKKISLGLAAVSLSASAFAATEIIDLSDVASWDAVGDIDNTILMIDLGVDSVVTGIGWDVTITPQGDSWYSEAAVGLGTATDPNLVSVRPGINDGNAGDGIPVAYSSGGIVDFSDNAIADITLVDGILILEFFESFDDIDGEIDSIWNGTLTIEFTPVPLPAAVWFLASGLGAMGFFGRKRA
ncbi:MAG: VPLPA-CTERM sorting domain-containing protein [Pseudomonadota bacterium]